MSAVQIEVKIHKGEPEIRRHTSVMVLVTVDISTMVLVAVIVSVIVTVEA